MLKNKKILVSACLLGVNCKYNGKSNYKKEIAALKDHNILIPVCPEVLGGLSTPRPPAEINGNMVINSNGDDVTAQFKKGAASATAIADTEKPNFCILKANSPSCGFDRIYDGTFSKSLITGRGLTAEALINKGYKVFDENNFIDTLKSYKL